MVSSLTSKHKAIKHSSPPNTSTNSTQSPSKSPKLPAFTKHFTMSNTPGTTTYKVGDSKDWGGPQ